MNTKPFKLVFVLLAVLGLISSCSVQQRRYKKGFYVSGFHSPVKNQTVENAFVAGKIAPDSCATIEFADGTSIKGKIVDITSKEIYYRYCNDDGKEHRCSKLRLKSIKYPNGSIENFDPNTRPEIPTPMPVPVPVPSPQPTQIDTIKGVPVGVKSGTVLAPPTQTSTCDVIVFRDGTEEDAMVKEVNDETVRYKLCSMPDGPDFVKSKNDIFMIKYKNGVKDVFKTNDSYPEIKTINQNAATGPKPREGLAMASLAASILGIYPLTLIGSIVGLILGLIYLQKNRINPQLYPEVKVARAGVIISLVVIALFAILVLLLLSVI